MMFAFAKRFEQMPIMRVHAIEENNRFFADGG